MIESTNGDLLDATMDPTSAGSEFMAAMDAAYADVEYVAAMDATSAAFKPCPSKAQPEYATLLPVAQTTENPTVSIDEELQAWIQPLSPAELAGLEASLLADGCRDPLVTWGGYLLDGHNRYALCTKHGIAFQTVEKSGLASKEDALIWMIDNQLGKRNTTDFARVALALKRKPLAEARAKARMLAGQTDPRQNSDEGPTRTDETIAKAAGVSRDTVRKVEKIIEKAGAEVIAQVRTGELSINAAAKTVTPPKPDKPAAKEGDAAAREVAKPRLTSEKDAVAVTDVEALRNENAELREQLEDLKEELAKTLADNVMMARVFETNDHVKAALVEVERYRAVAEQANRTLAARSHEFIDRANIVAYWKKRAEKFEVLLANAKGTGDPSALLAENVQLRVENSDMLAQLQDEDEERNALAARLQALAMEFEVALDYHDEISAILDAVVPLAGAPQQLQQALELTQMLANRWADVQCRPHEAVCAEEHLTQPAHAHLTEQVEQVEQVDELTEAEASESLPLSADDIAQALVVLD